MTLHLLKGKARTKKDRLFYSLALSFQQNQKLTEGCTAEEYSSRARAFLTKINPNLQNPYTGDDGHGNDDISEYLIELMPASMRTTGNQIKMELKMNKLYSNHEEVITKCKAAVFEEQKGGNAKPSFLLTHQAISLASVDVNMTGDIVELYYDDGWWEVKVEAVVPKAAPSLEREDTVITAQQPARADSDRSRRTSALCIHTKYGMKLEAEPAQLTT